MNISFFDDKPTLYELDFRTPFLEKLSDKEEDFIDRAKSPKLNSRLACQCILLDDNKNIVVTIPDQSLLLGD